MNKISTYLFYFLFFLSGIKGFGQKNEEGLTRILFIFDASNSMNAPWDGSSRIEIARKIMTETVDSLKSIPNLELALRIYGHQTPILPGQQDCNDTKLEVPFAPNNHEQIKSWVKYVIPKGTTPIARSLEKAGDDFPECKGCHNIIVLITDGIEACDEDPCAIARALKPKGIIVKPFVVGVGLNMDYLKALECIGTVYDASNEETFRNVLQVVVSQALNNTTAHVDILDINKKATQTNIAYTLYDQKSGAVRHNYIHTLDKGKPDTLTLDPLTTYRLVIHTVPQVEKKNIRLVPGKHNVIQIDGPQGELELKLTGGGKAVTRINCIVRKKDDMQTLNVQDLNSKQEYLVGTYDLEILTLPRILMDDVNIRQSQTTKIEIPFPGTLDLTTQLMGYGAIFIQENGEMKWVCDIKDDIRKQFIMLQPGNYKMVYRNKRSDHTIYSFEKSFVIRSNQSTVLSL